MNPTPWRAAATGACLAFLIALLGSCSRQAADIRTLDDAKGARIGVMTGSVGEAIVRARYPGNEVQVFDDIMDAVAAVKAGHLDGIATAWTTAFQVTKRNPDLRIVEEELEREEVCAALRLADTELLAAFNRAIDAMAADGTLAEMKARWVKKDLSPYVEPELGLPTSGEPLRIGVSATREPLTFVRDGKVSGHDGELALRIGKALGRPVEFSDMKFMALIPALESGRIDAIVTGMNSTAERSKRVAFTKPYFANPQVLLVRDADAATAPAQQAAPTVESLRAPGTRIAVQTGTVYDLYVKEKFPLATPLAFSNYPDVTLAVASGKADAGLSDAISLVNVMEVNPELVVVGPPIFSSTVAAAFRKTDPQLRAEFNAMLRELRADGTYASMVDRWMKQRSKTMPAIPNPGTNGTLTVGTSSWGLPFCGVQDGRLSGFDVELAERLAARLGKQLAIADQDFGGLIPALVSGKIDVILADMFATEERAKQIDFSDPYYDQDSVIFARVQRAASDQSFWQKLGASFESNILHEKRYLLLLDGLWTTALIAVLATLFGTVLGAFVCFARMSPRKVLQLPARVYISVLRGIPVLVLLMLVFYVVFGSVNVSPVLIAVLAFGMNFAAYVSEMFRAGLSSIDRGQREAGAAMGFTQGQTFRFILLPQLIQRVLPVYKGEFISMVKMTSIVGYIAVQDLTKASDIIRSRTFDAFFPLVMVAVLYFLMSWLLVQALEHLERVTDPRHRRAKAGAA